MSIEFRQSLENIKIYQAGKSQSGFSKLSSNENPFAPEENVLCAAKEAINICNLYPDSNAKELIDALSKEYSLESGNIAVSAGSIDILRCILTSLKEGDIISPWRSFEAYPLLCFQSGHNLIRVPLNDNQSINLDLLLKNITKNTRAIILCSPNNPTSLALEHEEVERFISKVNSDILIILDEAYAEFVNSNTALNGLEFVNKYSNVVSVRTFSKAYALAGLRVGYALGAEHIIEAIKKMTLPFCLTTPSIKAATKALQEKNLCLQKVQEIINIRDAIYNELKIYSKANGYGFFSAAPQGNFIWLFTGEATEKAVEICSKYHFTPRVFREGVRITISSHKEANKILDASKEILSII